MLVESLDKTNLIVSLSEGDIIETPEKKYDINLWCAAKTINLKSSVAHKFC